MKTMTMTKRRLARKTDHLLPPIRATKITKQQCRQQHRQLSMLSIMAAETLQLCCILCLLVGMFATASAAMAEPRPPYGLHHRTRPIAGATLQKGGAGATTTQEDWSTTRRRFLAQNKNQTQGQNSKTKQTNSTNGIQNKNQAQQEQKNKKTNATSTQKDQTQPGQKNKKTNATSTQEGQTQQRPNKTKKTNSTTAGTEDDVKASCEIILDNYFGKEGLDREACSSCEKHPDLDQVYILTCAFVDVCSGPFCATEDLGPYTCYERQDTYYVQTQDFKLFQDLGFAGEYH
jgi:hypothetical protein